jgi:hypothetical protein
VLRASTVKCLPTFRIQAQNGFNADLNTLPQRSMNSTSKPSPYRWRTSLRRYLPWFLIDLGVAAKGEDCETAGGSHGWYNIDGKRSACYHCRVVRTGRLWQQPDT